MNSKKLVRISNLIGLISIFLLIYWVITFIIIQVFELKVFRENITEAFYMSVFGILALMAGALIVNIMFNLTRIAEKHNKDDVHADKGKKLGWWIIASFGILAVLLFGGDYLSSKKKERFLVSTANSMIEKELSGYEHLTNYSFNESWIIETSEILEVMSKVDKSFPNVSVIVLDTIKGKPLFLSFGSNYYGKLNDARIPEKIDFIKETTQSERKYLEAVFNGGTLDYRYSAHDGSYELFYPLLNNNKAIVLYFSKYDRYGKIGS